MAADTVALKDAVLVVDDEPVVLQVFEQSLPMRGFAVTSARTAEQALEIAASKQFACLLTDKNLPGMSGLALVERFRELQPDCACVLMTGYASTASAVEALRLGANDYLEKPFDDLELVAEKLKLAIQNQRAMSDRALFLRQVLDFRRELEQRDYETAAHLSQIRTFNEIIERRVAMATADLRGERDQLLAKLSSGGGAPNEGELIAVKMAKMLLEQVINRPDVAALRGELSRIQRQLDDHLRALSRRSEC
jgi:DNA-binding NtrC family response regulator